MRLGVMFFCGLIAPSLAFAQPLPPLACESRIGTEILGIYGPVAQIRTSATEDFSTSGMRRDENSNWPVYMVLRNADKDLTLRLSETRCTTTGGSFPLRAEVYSPDTALRVFCCTGAE